MSKTDEGTKGEVTARPIIMGVHARKNKKNQLVIVLCEHTIQKMFANAYQLNRENDEEYYGASQFFYEARYATNPQMKKAVSAGLMKWDRGENIITRMKKGKTYYLQIRPVAEYHAGVA